MSEAVGQIGLAPKALRGVPYLVYTNIFATTYWPITSLQIFYEAYLDFIFMNKNSYLIFAVNHRTHLRVM